MPTDGVALSARLPIIIHSGGTTVSGLRRYTRVVERDEYKHQRKPKGLAKFISQSEEDKQKAREALSEMRVKQSMCNNYVCRICYPPQRFTALSSLQSHYKSHLGIKEFTCTLCHKSFTRKMSLDYHMLIHAHKTRFRCDSCGHEFRHKSHYAEHLRRHTGETPYICSECGQGFKAKNSYRRHLVSKHGQRLTLNGNIVILSDEEHRNLLDRSHGHERSRKRGLPAGSPAPHSPSKTGFSLVDVVVRDATGQVEYMCNVDSGIAADTPPPPLLKPLPSPPPDVLRQVVEATVTDEAPPLPPHPPSPPLPRVNITSSIGNYDVFYSSGNVANTFYVK